MPARGEEAKSRFKFDKLYAYVDSSDPGFISLLNTEAKNSNRYCHMVVLTNKMVYLDIILKVIILGVVLWPTALNWLTKIGWFSSSSPNIGTLVRFFTNRFLFIG
uniref:Uncharacterized protein n=1 Tax=Glomus sp. DAOM 229456 TaxID=1264587 RepID=M9NS77_9GLOM|nr:hypothetical protein [Glomus sp. DAOM 229456]